MNAKHTPGPWRVVIRANQRGIRSLTIDTGHLTGGTYCKMGASELQPEDEANARLIAAAPDLLEACKAVMAGDAFDERYRDLCAAAIRKAEGRAE
jgi:hypothetical protein